MSDRPVLEIRVHELDRTPSLTSVCPGYEQGAWRAKDLVRDTFDRHLATFALPYSDTSTMNSVTSAALLRRAARTVYTTDTYANRGEFGELFLHAICLDIFDSEPAISKITFKDSANDTVKGFDCVHVVAAEDGLELWLGEVKFYSSLASAIYDVTVELAKHLAYDYLRSEFVAVTNKLDPNWPHADQIKLLLAENTSLDVIFDSLTVPVLLTYDSAAVGRHGHVSEEYINDIKSEANDAWDKFQEKCEPTWNVRLRLILMPLLSKTQLVELMHERLQAWQQV